MPHGTPGELQALRTELLDDYALYVNDMVDLGRIPDAWPIWLRDPVECDQELAQPYIDWVARTDAERDR